MLDAMEERMEEVEKVGKGAKLVSGTTCNLMDHMNKRLELLEKKK